MALWRIALAYGLVMATPTPGLRSYIFGRTEEEERLHQAKKLAKREREARVEKATLRSDPGALAKRVLKAVGSQPSLALWERTAVSKIIADMPTEQRDVLADGQLMKQYPALYTQLLADLLDKDFGNRARDAFVAEQAGHDLEEEVAFTKAHPELAEAMAAEEERVSHDYFYEPATAAAPTVHKGDYTYGNYRPTVEDYAYNPQAPEVPEELASQKPGKPGVKKRPLETLISKEDFEALYIAQGLQTEDPKQDKENRAWFESLLMDPDVREQLLQPLKRKRAATGTEEKTWFKDLVQDFDDDPTIQLDKEKFAEILKLVDSEDDPSSSSGSDLAVSAILNAAGLGKGYSGDDESSDVLPRPVRPAAPVRPATPVRKKPEPVFDFTRMDTGDEASAIVKRTDSGASTSSDLRSSDRAWLDATLADLEDDDSVDLEGELRAAELARIFGPSESEASSSDNSAVLSFENFLGQLDRDLESSTSTPKARGPALERTDTDDSHGREIMRMLAAFDQSVPSSPSAGSGLAEPVASVAPIPLPPPVRPASVPAGLKNAKLRKMFSGIRV